MDVKNMSMTMWGYSQAPLLLVANNFKFDYWSLDDLRIILRLDDDIPLIPCNAKDSECVKRVLLALCEENLKYGTSSV
ncbi:MAG: hypothetical protein AAFR56_14210 [Chloroflexota bacterium]